MPKQVRIAGVTYTVPDNATMDQIQEYVASKGVTAPKASKSQAQNPQPTRTDFLSKLSENMGVQLGPDLDRRTPGEAGLDAAGHVLKGIPQAVTGIPKTLAELSDIVHNSQSLGTIGLARIEAVDMFKGMAAPFTTPARALAAEIAPGRVARPSKQEMEQSQEGAGAMAGGLLLGEAAGRVASKLPKAAEGLYQESLKPGSRVNTNAEIKSRVRTGLKNNIPVSESGLGRLQGLVDQLNSSISSDISKDPSAPISPTSVASRVNPSIDNFEYRDLQHDATAAGKEQSRFRTEHSDPVSYSPYPPPHEPSLSFPVEPATYRLDNPIEATRAQSMKQGIWQELNKNDFGTVSEGYKQARKQLGRGLKEELENIFPEIKGKNAAEGELLDLQPDIEAAVNRLGNKPALSRVLHIFSDPAIVSHLAIALHRAGVPASQISSRLAAAGFVGGTVKNRREALELLGK